MKIGCTDSDAPVPKSLFKSGVPPEILFGLQRRQRLSGKRIESKNLVLAAGWTEPRRHARVQRRVCFVDLVTARDSIGPNVTELVEVIEASAGDENEIVDVYCRLQKSRDLLRLVPNECWAKQHERTFLS